ncbi:HD domain-containing phosphohydrolase [Paracholeplasma manati]|uniref:Response regulator n=1 Tax=Paracholeplasma manati TaxID=591373 RepID=A0ABT2YBS6_9MOLU|nr:HD domain-containing phosphohydrolase [Paracholeplasma manati]MCV2232623.1 response regulator [Paracholeplasma manati]MDG0889481.1 response regulator [Paracholeplasma manati]
MKVLVAESNQKHRDLLVQYLEEEQIQVLTAADGQKALEVWSNEDPKIIIMDINMPDMDGFSIIEEIRRRELDHTYIIVATEHEEVILGRSFDVGADDFISVPIRKTELIYRIKASEKVISNQENQTVIYALAQLTETRDIETGRHLERIGMYTKVIATELKNHPIYKEHVTSQFINHLTLSSVLHDIGKVGIEDAVLRKKGIYTDEERKTMQAHTIIGASTIDKVADKYPFMGFLKMASEIARYHHEKWDGTGYPEGLKGEDIPLSARIVAIADVFDALISERYYKPKYSFEESKRIILESSGKHFDPVIVEAFLKHEAEFYAIAHLD